MGTGDHVSGFLDLANRRSGEYGGCTWCGEPGHAMCRSLGAHIQHVMGSDQTNKWVMDQVTDIDAPELHRRFSDSLNSLVESS